MHSPFSEYLSTVPLGKRAAIERVKAIAEKCVPSTAEGVSYGMPALMYKGKPYLSCMATKKGLSIYPFSGKVGDKLAAELKDFEGTPGSIHFTEDHELSEALLEKVIKARLEEIEAKLKK